MKAIVATGNSPFRGLEDHGEDFPEVIIRDFFSAQNKAGLTAGFRVGNPTNRCVRSS